MTTENSRADAQFLTATDEQHVQRFRQRDYSCIIEVQEIAAVVRYICALEKTPVEQPPAAPIEAISKLLDEAMDRAAANGADSRSMPDEYVAIAHFTCYPEEYGYAKPAPSPADEWAAFEAWARGKGSYTAKELEVFNGQYVDEHANAALDAWLAARAAPANETGAEGAKDDALIKRLCVLRGKLRHDVGAWEVVRDAIAALRRPPARADARVGLTDGRIARLRAAIEGECDGLHVDYHHAKAILAYLDDDCA